MVGGTLFQYGGVQCPFFVGAMINVLIMVLLVFTKNPDFGPGGASGTRQALGLLKDKDICVGLGKWSEEFSGWGNMIFVIVSL